MGGSTGPQGSQDAWEKKMLPSRRFSRQSFIRFSRMQEIPPGTPSHLQRDALPVNAGRGGLVRGKGAAAAAGLGAGGGRGKAAVGEGRALRRAALAAHEFHVCGWWGGG